MKRRQLCKTFGGHTIIKTCLGSWRTASSRGLQATGAGGLARPVPNAANMPTQSMCDAAWGFACTLSTSATALTSRQWMVSWLMSRNVLKQFSQRSIFKPIDIISHFVQTYSSSIRLVRFQYLFTLKASPFRLVVLFMVLKTDMCVCLLFLFLFLSMPSTPVFKNKRQTKTTKTLSQENCFLVPQKELQRRRVFYSFA